METTETNYSELRKAGLLIGTIKAAREKHEARILNKPRESQKSSARMVKARVVLRLGIADIRRAEHESRAANPRLRNWLAPKSTTRRQATGLSVAQIDNGRYSYRCTYTFYTYRPTVTAYAWRAYAGRSIGWRIWEETGHTPAPHGYSWGIDGNGLKLVQASNHSNDYHPTTDDLRTLSGREIAAKLRENAATRRSAEKFARAEAAEAKRQQDDDRAAIRRAEKEGAAICMADSIRAGNCQAGTEQFAARHGLDTKRHYRPTQLLKIANGDAHRVRLAVSVGLRRHRHEMAAGLCLIADHQA